jgi:rRNA-processing protein CGR1
MAKTQKEASIKKLQQDMKDEKQAEILRRKQITQDRRRVAEERRAAEELKAKVSSYVRRHTTIY